jgi:D-alanyl-D-alanine carboxypeptidase/D-alanyl-D-alanine-endopeptidase (penicillin-binding protein 4)
LIAAFGAMPASAEWSALEALARQGARVGAVAIDLDSGSIIQQMQPDLRLTPASLSKLIVTGAALDTWAADKVFTTEVSGAGPFRDGVIGGDLYLHGEGDATLEHTSLWALAAQIKSAGIRRVKGGLTVSTAPFGPLGCETKDRCEALEASDTAYHAPLAAIGVDYGNWCVEVRPTAPGRAALVRSCGGVALPIPIEGEIRTVSAKKKQSYWVSRHTDASGDRLRLSGDVPAGAGARVYRSMSDPALGVGLLLRADLRELGVQVEGPVAVVRDLPPADAYPLALFEGLSLREQLGRMLRHSNNYIADLLTLNLARVHQKRAPAQLAEAAETLAEFVQTTQGEKGRRQPPPLFSGSGLTPESEISALELARLLVHQYRDTRNFPAFFGGLVVPRQAPYTFLRQGNAAWLDRVALKTGTMSDPHSVNGIAGYLRKKNGGWIAFAVIVNGGGKQQRIPLYKSMEAVRGDMEKLLARY